MSHILHSFLGIFYVFHLIFEYLIFNRKIFKYSHMQPQIVTIPLPSQIALYEQKAYRWYWISYLYRLILVKRKTTICWKFHSCVWNELVSWDFSATANSKISVVDQAGLPWKTRKVHNWECWKTFFSTLTK